jgi:hypothetical protein
MDLREAPEYCKLPGLVADSLSGDRPRFDAFLFSLAWSSVCLSAFVFASPIDIFQSLCASTEMVAAVPAGTSPFLTRIMWKCIADIKCCHTFFRPDDFSSLCGPLLSLSHTRHIHFPMTFDVTAPHNRTTHPSKDSTLLRYKDDLNARWRDASAHRKQSLLLHFVPGATRQFVMMFRICASA